MKLQIPEPCSQKWEQMAFMNDSTRFCSECSSNIIDFSLFSDREITQKLWNNPGKICVKVAPKQLNRNLGESNFHFPGLKSLLLAGSLIALSNEYHAQVSETKVEQHRTKLDTAYQIIRGNVQDTSNTKDLHELLIELPHYNLFSQLDSIGDFQFSIPLNNLPDTLLLVVRKGNAYKSYNVANLKELIQIEVSLHPIEIDKNFILESQVIGLVVVKPKWYQFGFKFRRFCYRLRN
jgi:hypothetical protein